MIELSNLLDLPTFITEQQGLTTLTYVRFNMIFVPLF